MEILLPWQIQINLFLQHLPPWMIGALQWMTELGSELFYLVFMPLMYWCIDRAAGLRMGAMLMISNAMVNTLKMAIHWPRPYWLDPAVVDYVQETSFGLPSGHSANAAGVWGALATWVKQRWATIAAIVIIFLIGFSRLVLGVHFLTDVLVGWALGGLLLAAVLRLEPPIVRWFSRLVLRQQLGVAFFSSMLLILPAMLAAWLLEGWQIPASWQALAGHSLYPFSLEGTFTVGGTWAGFIAGVAWARKTLGRYTLQGSLLQRIFRYAIGVAGLVFLWAGLDRLFPDGSNTLGLSFRYLRYLVLGFWVTGLAPYLFLLLKLLQPVQSTPARLQMAGDI